MDRRDIEASERSFWAGRAADIAANNERHIAGIEAQLGSSEEDELRRSLHEEIADEFGGKVDLYDDGDSVVSFYGWSVAVEVYDEDWCISASTKDGRRFRSWHCRPNLTALIQRFRSIEHQLI